MVLLLQSYRKITSNKLLHNLLRLDKILRHKLLQFFLLFLNLFNIQIFEFIYLSANLLDSNKSTKKMQIMNQFLKIP